MEETSGTKETTESPSQPATLGSTMTVDQINRWIRYAWIVGVIGAFVTLFMALAAEKTGVIDQFSLWSLIDVFILLMLSFGIYQRSRAAAVMMLVYFALSKILQIAGGATLAGLVGGLLFGYFYVQGARAVFASHDRKLERNLTQSRMD